MPGSTPNRSYPYPLYGEAQDFPTQMQSMALAIDSDVTNNLVLPTTNSLDEPSIRVHRTVVQAIAPNVNVTLQYNTIVYQLDIGAPGGPSGQVTINQPGYYLVAGSVVLSPTGNAGGAAALVLTSSGGVLTNPVGVSRALDNDKDTAISYSTLHYVPTTPETLSQFVRHNHSVSINSGTSHMTVTRVSL